VPASAEDALKSATAILTFSTPSPVPVRIQSVCEIADAQDAQKKMIEAMKSSFLFINGLNPIVPLSSRCVYQLFLVVEPEFH
jgi:hypothetical protein